VRYLTAYLPHSLCRFVGGTGLGQLLLKNPVTDSVPLPSGTSVVGHLIMKFCLILFVKLIIHTS
jgi:hypothetical protein